MHRRIVLSVLLAAVATGACAKKEPPPPPTPVVNEDSIRAAREAEARARAEAEARARAEAEARAREAAAAAERARAALAAMVHFDYDKSDIRADAQQVLMQKVEVLRANPDVRIKITGHADERGSVEYNLALGMRRATSVKDFLAGYGIDAARFETASLGEERPIDPAQTEEAWAKNRRAEFEITAGGQNLVGPAVSQ
jgi:peptidoglycan-associated lipoprotein